MATGSHTKSRATKAEQAAATRARIVDAATELFLRDGFLTATMAAIAKQAQVAVQTLYLAFGSKTAILQAALDDALRGQDPDDIPEQEWYARVLEDPDGLAALQWFCHHGAQHVRRAAPLFAVMRAASSDPEVAEILSRNKQLRHDGFTAVAEALAARPGFAPGLTVFDAVGILYAVMSEDTFLLLVDEHGWPVERWAEWSERTLVDQLFPGGGRNPTAR